MKVRVTLINGNDYAVDLEANNILELKSFDDVVEFTPQKVLQDIDGNRLVVKSIVTYKELP